MMQQMLLLRQVGCSGAQVAAAACSRLPQALPWLPSSLRLQPSSTLADSNPAPCGPPSFSPASTSTPAFIQAPHMCSQPAAGRFVPMMAAASHSTLATLLCALGSTVSPAGPSNVHILTSGSRLATAAAASGLLLPGGVVRGYAKKTGGGGGGAAAAAPSVKKKRRSEMRLFACRNDRFRSAFEQIWPTLRLTQEEADMFKRNSRLFVIETGKPLALTTKFDALRPPAPLPQAPDAPIPTTTLKPHYADAKVSLFESQLHLDAIGEQPRYLKIRRIRSQFGIRMQNTRKVRLLLGFARRGYLQHLHELAQVQPGPNKVWKLICALESRLAMFALRMGLAPDAIEARQVIRNKVFINGLAPQMKDAYMMELGDVVGPATPVRAEMQDRLGSAMASLMYDVHRDNLV